MVSWSTAEARPLPWLGVHIAPSLSVKEVLQVGESNVSSAANTRPVCRSVNPIGSESMNSEVGARRSTQVALGVVGEQDSSHETNKVSRSDWKLVIPPTELEVESQFTPIDGSPAPRP